MFFSDSIFFFLAALRVFLAGESITRGFRILEGVEVSLVGVSLLWDPGVSRRLFGSIGVDIGDSNPFFVSFRFWDDGATSAFRLSENSIETGICCTSFSVSPLSLFFVETRDAFLCEARSMSILSSLISFATETDSFPCEARSIESADRSVTIVSSNRPTELLLAVIEERFFSGVWSLLPLLWSSSPKISFIAPIIS